MTTGDSVLSAMQAMGIKVKRENDHYRSNSPLRPGSDSYGFVLRIDSDGEHGAYHDHVTGDNGSLYDLAKLLNVELPKIERLQVVNTRRAYRDLDEYAALKGVDKSVFVAAGWSDEVKHDHEQRPYIEFRTATGARRRYLDNGKDKFKSPQGYKRCWYGLRAAAAKAQQQGLPLVMCNGEPSAVIGQHFGVPAFAMTGGETANIPAELLEELRGTWQGDIVIALDCDKAGAKGAAKYAETLRESGYAVTVVDLGLSDKGDLADYCKLHSADAMPQLRALAKSTAEHAKTAAQREALEELRGLVKQLVQQRKTENAQAPDMPLLLDKLQAELDAARRKVSPARPEQIANTVAAQRARLAHVMQYPDDVQGLRSHIVALDTFIGGFVPGRIYTIYGDTGMGKTTLAISAVSAMMHQAPGLVVPTELTPGAWLDKLVAHKTTVPSHLIETGALNSDQHKAVLTAYAVIDGLPMFILADIAPRPAELSAMIRDGVKEHGWQWILFDSISRMKATKPDASVYERISEIADFTQEMARMGLMVIQTSQVGRNLKDRENKIPELHDALGSGAVEQNSDVVLALYNHQRYVSLGQADEDEENFPKGTVAVRCLKHRWRGQVEGKAIKLKFRGGMGMYDV